MPADLDVLVATLADWAKGHPDVTIYLFGSRVRGDHRPDSDVDVVVRWERVTQEFFDWWTGENEDEFRRINARLPGPLKILENEDGLTKHVLAAAASPVLSRGNVVCVWLPPKPPQTGSF